MNLGITESATSRPCSLLRSYLAEHRCEKAFTRLVTLYAPLIHSSAFRRCGNRALSEEVTQDVLTLLARKAPSLAKHPNLTAWVFQTTRLETAKAMRTEQRRNKKHERYSNDPLFSDSTSLQPEQQASWNTLLPHLDSSLDQLSDRDRDLILKRFFEKQKFKDIAQELKASEGACKMQLKRALERLGSILQSHGSSLPVATLSSGLFASLVAPTPTALASQAISSSSEVSFLTTLTNTILTMTNTQKIVVSSFFLITATSIPAIQMAKESSRLQSQLQALHIEGTSPELSKKSKTGTSRRNHFSSRRTVKSLLASQSDNIDALIFLERMSKALTATDYMLIMQLCIPVAEMEPEQLKAFLAELNNINEYPKTRAVVIETVTSFSSEQFNGSFQEKLEHFLSQSSETSDSLGIFKQWAAKNPQEALAWFQKMDAAGALTGTGVADHSFKYFSILLKNIHRSSPEQAEKLYYEAYNQQRFQTVGTILQPIIQRLHESHDLEEFKKFLDKEPASNVRSHAVLLAARKAQTLPVILEILALDDNPSTFSNNLTDAVDRTSWVFQEKALALQENLSQKEYETGVSNILHNHDGTQSQTLAWLKSQPAGAARDQWISSYIWNLSVSKQFESAQLIAQEIQNPQVRINKLVSIAESWLQQDPEKAEEHIAPEILDKLRR